MADICGGKGFLLNVTEIWETDNPRLSQCFSRTVLVLLPALLIVINYLQTLRQFLKKSPGIRRVPNETSYTILVRIFILWLLLSLKIGIIVIDVNTEDLASTADLVYYTGSLLVLLLNMVVQVLHYRLKVFSSSLQFLYWLAHVLCYLPTFKLSIERLIQATELPLSLLSVSYFSLSLVVLASQWKSNWRLNIASEEKSPYPQWLTFSWLGPTFKTGFKSDKLGVGDLPEVNKKINVPKILEIFLKNYSSLVKFFHTRTLTVLIKSFGGSFLIGALLRLLNDILLYMTPLVFRKIIQSIEAAEEEWKGYMWVFLLLLTATCQVTISNHYFRQTYVAAFQMRTAVICAIYRKTLTIANHARQKFTSGEITNLMSIDAQRFIEIVPFLNTVWSGPFQFALAIYFLYDLVGLSALAGLAVFAILVPINIYGGKFGRKIQLRQMKAKDERILLMNEVLQGMKVLKLYAWEKPFMRKIKESRDQEINCIKQNALLNALLFVTYTGAPLLVTLITFTIYVLSDQNNVLTAEKVFATVAVFNVVRIPMNQFPRFLMESVKLFVSLRRIDDFLSCEDIHENQKLDFINKSFSSDDVKADPTALVFNNASFSWSKSCSSPTLKDLNLNIKKGDLVAVVGKIGSGKSSLLSSILGEMVGVSGDVKTSGSVAYVAQQAWIQNMTVRDNILFGKPLDHQKYQEVVSACDLLSDLKILPAGDQTEIGENGVNLSGGQKQRISLARAAYHEADIVLLDDPLSAVDAHVGRHLFERLIGPTGLLRDKTRILVTHNLSYLNRVDRILVFQEGRMVEQGSLHSLKASEGSAFQEFTSFISESVTELEPEAVVEAVVQLKDTKAGDKGEGELTSKESKAEGRVSWRHYICYLKSMNILLFVVVIFLFLVAEAFKVGGNLTLAKWTENFSSDTSGTYIAYYGLMALACSLAGMLSQMGCQFRAAEASRKIHQSLLEKTMHAPMSFFETTPTGRILNR